MIPTADPSINGMFASAGGYWTPRHRDIWRSLTPDQRDYDRYQGWFPPGEGACETEYGRRQVMERQERAYDDEHACRCHINPPCWHCTECPDCTVSEE